MKRRDFIKVTGATLAAAVIVPSIILASNDSYPIDEIILYHEDGRFHSFGKEKITVYELHCRISDVADNMILNREDTLDIIDETPSTRITNNMIRIEKPWRLTLDSMKLLEDGSIEQGDELYTSITVLGWKEEDKNETIVQVGGVDYEENEFLANTVNKEILVYREDMGYNVRKEILLQKKGYLKGHQGKLLIPAIVN